MGARSRRKGASYEREIAARLKAIYPQARRGLGQARAGHEVADVDGTPGWWIQCKCGARPNLFEALTQAVNDCQQWQSRFGAEKRSPIVIARRDRGPDVAVLLLDDLLPLLAATSQVIEPQTKGIDP